MMRHFCSVAAATLVVGCSEMAATSGQKTLNRSGIELVQSGSYTAAEPILVRALKSEEQSSGPNSLQTSNIVYNLGWLYRLEGRYAEAEPLLRRALLIQDGVRDPAQPFLPTTLNEYGYVLLLQGRYAEAESLFRRALSLQEQAPSQNGPVLATTIENLGFLFRLQGRYAEARAYYERTRSIRERTLGPDDPELARTLSNLGTLNRLEGRLQEAEPLERRALQIREKSLGPRHPAVADSLYDLGNLYRAERRYADSKQALERGISVQTAAVGSNHPIVATRGYAGLVKLYQEMGRPQEALIASNQAVEILKQQLTDGRAERSVSAVTERRLYRDLFLENITLIDRAGESNRVASSLVAAQYAQATTAGQALARMAGQFAAGNDALGGSIRRLQDSTEQWQQLEAQLLKVVGTAPADRDEAAETSLRARLVATDREITTLSERIGREFPQYSDVTGPKAVPLETVQKLLAPDEAMVVYLVGPETIWLWAIRNNAASLHRLDISAEELTAEVAGLRATLDPDTNPSLRPFPVNRAYRLYQRILAVAEPTIRGAHHLIFVSDGPLETLPMSVLVTEPAPANPVTPADHRSIHWLAKDYAVSVLPSVASLRALRSFAHSSRASSPFFGIGNPALGGSDGGPSEGRGTVAGLGPVLSTSLRASPSAYTRDPGETRRAVAALSPLPETATELHAIAEIAHASERDLLLGRKANEQELRDAPLARYRVIEFATHGLKPGDLGLTEPALVLTPTGRTGEVDDGLLTASKVATLKLDADWVVLSACNTGVSANGKSDGFSALATAFFHAGARSVLISHWSVPSGPTVLLTAGAFAALADSPGIGRSEALRRSMMAMLSPSRPSEFAHPLVWAPFSLAGDAGN